MDCFNHPDRSAVGVCKSCGRGLCHDCAVDSPNGLSCKGCEARVRLMNKIIDNNAKVMSVARRHSDCQSCGAYSVNDVQARYNKAIDKKNRRAHIRESNRRSA